MVQRHFSWARVSWGRGLVCGALLVSCGVYRSSSAPESSPPASPPPPRASLTANDELVYQPAESEPAREEASVSASSEPPPPASPVPASAPSKSVASQPQGVVALGEGRGTGQGFGGSARLSSKSKARPGVVLRGRRVRAAGPHLEPPPTSQEEYAAVTETPFASVTDQPLSTFSIDVDTASYSNVRRMLARGQLPPRGAVRVEELINYFPYEYAEPTGDEPFSMSVEVSQAPWNPQHQLMHVGLQGKRVSAHNLPPRNLVFLLDVSGSMESPNKLPLLRRALGALAETLREQDEVAIVVYAGASGLVLPPTSGSQQAKIFAALDRLQAGGSTNGAAGIQLAYEVARGMAEPGSSTRVVLATDGDFNVGVTSQSELYRLIEDKRKSGVFLSVLGFGMGNYKDSTLELLADKGNGNYAYVDTLNEARKVLVREGGATLHTIAKDVKLQLEFNPTHVAAYRLIGYENRRLAARDFNDDKKDAGELGAGHSVTALYELIPPGGASARGVSSVDPLRYQGRPSVTSSHPRELATLKLRYKLPEQGRSRLVSHAVRDETRSLSNTSAAFRFSAAVASFGMTLTGSPERGSSSFELTRRLAEGALGEDPHGYRREFLQLVQQARALSPAMVGALAQ